MERYEQDDEPDVTSELGALAFEAGYGQRILDVERANSSEAVGDRIVEAAGRLHGAGLWDEGEQS